jgi:DNA-directed RNA polymerase specialized sigma24 family protein
MTATDRDTEFTGFVVSCAPSLRHTAYLLTGDRHAAEDLLQDALTKTWLAWQRIDGAARRAYVRKVMVNLATDREEPVMSPMNEDDLRHLLQVRDPGGADDAAIAAAAIGAGRRARHRRTALAVTTVAALTVAAVAVSPLLSPTVTTLPLSPATSDSAPPHDARILPRTHGLDQGARPPLRGPRRASRRVGRRLGAPRGPGRLEAAGLLARVQPGRLHGDPTFSFEALAELDVGRSGALAGGRYQSVLRFVDDAAAGLFVSELVTQAQGCVDSPGDGAGDGTRDRWTVTSTPDGVAITLVTEVSEGGVWTRHPLATEEHLLFRRDGNAVAMASGRTDAMGPTPEVLDDQLDAAVAALIGR